MHKKDFTAAAGLVLLEDSETGGFRIVTDILAFKVSGLGLEEGQAIWRLLSPIGELEGKFLSSA